MLAPYVDPSVTVIALGRAGSPTISGGAAEARPQAARVNTAAPAAAMTLRVPENAPVGMERRFLHAIGELRPIRIVQRGRRVRVSQRPSFLADPRAHQRPGAGAAGHRPRDHRS